MIFGIVLLSIATFFAISAWLLSLDRTATSKGRDLEWQIAQLFPASENPTKTFMICCIVAAIFFVLAGMYCLRIGT